MSFTDVLGRTYSDEIVEKRGAALTFLRDDRSAATEIHYQARLLADGFGRITPASEGFREMIWDWSHVRDSSPEGIERIFTYLTDQGVI